MSSRTSAQTSLLRRLLQRVTLTLIVAWLAGTAISTGLATHFAQMALDRSLLEDARAIASRVRLNDGQIDVHLNTPETEYLIQDPSGNVFYAVITPQARLVAGHPGFESLALTEHDQPHFLDVEHNNQTLRAVVLPVWDPIRLSIVIGKSTTDRASWLLQSLLYSLLLEALLLVFLAHWLQSNVESDLHPLSELRKAIELRDSSDLSPLSHVVRASADTRDIDQLGQAIDDLLHKVQVGIEAQKTFAGNVAHELRTPLAGIRTLAEYGLRHSDPQVWRQQLLAITDSQERASHIIDQLLALALATEASQALVVEPVALDNVVRELLLRIYPKADLQGADLGAEGLEPPTWVLAHRGLLEGLLGNLVNNALRYGFVPPAKAVVTVAILPDPTAQRVWLSVTDLGPGLTPDQLALLQQRWSQGSQAQFIGQGHGLGLDIVRRYAALLQAPLEFNAGPEGRGLCVRVGLNASTPQSPPPPPAHPA